MTAEIDVLHGKHAPGLELVVKPGQSRARITKVGQNKPDIDQIISVIRLWAGRDILGPEMDILESKGLRFFLGEQYLCRIEVDPGHMSLRHHAAQRNGDVPPTTAHVQASRVRGKRERLQERQRGGPHNARKKSQPLSAFKSTLNQVAVRCRQSCALQRVVVLLSGTPSPLR